MAMSSPRRSPATMSDRQWMPAKQRPMPMFEASLSSSAPSVSGAPRYGASRNGDEVKQIGRAECGESTLAVRSYVRVGAVERRSEVLQNQSGAQRGLVAEVAVDVLRKVAAVADVAPLVVEYKLRRRHAV